MVNYWKTKNSWIYNTSKENKNKCGKRENGDLVYRKMPTAESWIRGSPEGRNQFCSCHSEDWVKQELLWMLYMRWKFWWWAGCLFNLNLPADPY